MLKSATPLAAASVGGANKSAFPCCLRRQAPAWMDENAYMKKIKRRSLVGRFSARAACISALHDIDDKSIGFVSSCVNSQDSNTALAQWQSYSLLCCRYWVRFPGAVPGFVLGWWYMQ